MNEIENLSTDQLHRPKTAPIIFSVNIITHPFKDLYPRDIRWNNDDKLKHNGQGDPKTQKKTPQLLKKRLKLESSDSEVEENTDKIKIKSSHDLLADKHLLKEAIELKKNKIEKKSETKQNNNLKNSPINNEPEMPESNMNDGIENYSNKTNENKDNDEKDILERQVNVLKNKISRLNKKKDLESVI